MEAIQEIQEQPPKIDKRKKHIEYGSYKEYVKETKYNTKYYHSSKKAIECPICQKPTYERFLKQHQRSMKCRLIKHDIKTELV